MSRSQLLAAAILAAASATSASASTVLWTDWTSATTTTVHGAIIGAPSVTVNFSTSGEALNFVHLSSGTNYWTEGTPAPYTGGSVSNAPPSPDIISLNAGGTKTITFSQTVTNPYIAFVSWNGNTAVFDHPFVKISDGCGYWGCGTFAAFGNAFIGSGEVHGILQFPGTFTTLSFADTNENWHGLTIGIDGVAAVPEPPTWALMMLGIGGLGAMLRTNRRRQGALTVA